MRHKNLISASLFFANILLLAACVPTANPAETLEAVNETALTLSGSAAEVSYTEEDLRAMPQSQTDYTDKDGETTIYEGIAFADLLSESGMSDYTSLIMIAADDYSAEVTADELSSCSGCIVAFQKEGGLRAVMPDFSGKLQVKDLVAITINN